MVAGIAEAVMQGARASDKSIEAGRSLAEQVLRLVLYYDVFAHPLNTDEVQRFVGGGLRSIEQAVAHLASMQKVVQRGRWIHAPGREGVVERRAERARNAERMWPAAYRSAAVLARFPFIRGVLITGGLSKNAVGDDADVDFFLIVEPGHVWTTKSSLQAFRRTLPEPLRECFCTNYLIAADQLVIDEHNMFTAMELATAVPMYGPDICTALMDANRDWAGEHVWNQEFVLRRAQRAPRRPRPVWTRGVERAAALVPDLDERALAFWDRYWNRKYGWLPPDRRSQRFKRREDVATNHLNDFQGWVLREWKQRCADAGIEDS